MAGSNELRGVLIVALALSLLTSSITAPAQQPENVYRIGYLRRASPEAAHLEAFRQGLRELGYSEGRTVVIEQRYANGAHERLPALARELVQSKVQVFVVDGPLTVRAVRQVAQLTPVIFTVVGDPVGEGFAQSLARPGGMVTGLTNFSGELFSKRLQLLAELVPLARIAVLYNPANTPGSRLDPLRHAARSRDIKLSFIEVRKPDDLAGVFKTMRQEGINAVLVANDAMLYGQRTRLVALAAQHQLPAMYEERLFVEVGGLISYGPDQSANFKRAALFVDKIIKGAKAADLPIEQPTKVDLAINLRTAKALGLSIPRSVLLQADEVVE
jgi:putative tryptophan/tyrosine transport system substrate-binding protein